MAKAYIDTEELLNTLEDYIEYNTFDIYQEDPLIKMSFKQLEYIVTSQPTAEVVEVVHGEWIEKWDRKHMVGRCFCNSCRRGTYKDSHLKWIKSAYCPNCGAKMDGKRVE